MVDCQIKITLKLVLYLLSQFLGLVPVTLSTNIHVHAPLICTIEQFDR